MSPSRRPNILFFTADELRFDCLGCTGNPVVKTRHIDRLASDGVRFPNAYTTAPLCVPARQSVITGQYPTAHGARSNRSAIPEGRETMASLLRDAGYQTAAVGKMHFWPVYASYGFSWMRLAEQDGPGWKIDDYHGRFLPAQGLVDQWDLWDQQEEFRRNAPEEYWQSYGARPSEIPEQLHQTRWIADQAIEFLRQVDPARPFFLWCSFIKPHHPFDPPPPYDQMYDPAKVVLPPRGGLWRVKPLLASQGDPRIGYFDVRGMAEADLRRVVAYYYGLISHVDHHIGRVLEALAGEGLADDTLIVFFSDHGDYLGQYDLFLKHPNIPYDALVRVPLIVSGPRSLVSSRGRVRQELVSLVDLAATAFDAAGIQAPDYIQGKSLLPLVRGGEGEHHRAVFMENDDYRAVRSPDYKYIYHPTGPLEELYHITEDPYELYNLEPRLPGIVAEHRQLVLDWMIASSWDRHGHGRWELP